MVVYTSAAALFVLILIVIIASFVDGNIEEDEGNCKPQHVHLAYGDSLEEMVVVWATRGACSTELELTIEPWAWSWSHRVSGNSSEFWEQNIGGLHYLHRIKLTNLKPTTTYYYRPLSNNIGSGPFYFKTPSTNVNWSPHFLVFGDLGIHTQTIPTLVEEALKGEYTAVIHAGDFAYNFKDNDGLVGDQFMELIQPVAAYLPYMTCPGNHEIDSDTFTHYNHRFSMPGSPWPMSPDRLWYSFNVGPAHFISYSSEVFFTQGGAFVQKQFDWLVSDLRRANSEREKYPWIIAFGHRPMYCSVNNDDDCTKNNSLVRQGLEDLFYGFGVDIILQAHEHNYERLYPMYHGVVLSTSYVDPPAPIHIISGAAGSKHGVDPFQMPPKRRHNRVPSGHKNSKWSAVRVEQEALNSYGRLDIVNNTHAYWEQRSVYNSTVLDSLWIVQHHHHKFQLSSNLTADINNELKGVTLSVEKETQDKRKAESFQVLTEFSDLFADEDPKERERELKENDTTQRIAIGASFGVLFAMLLAVAALSRACKRRRHYSSVRRWDATDLDYGRKLFSSTTATTNAATGREDGHDADQDYEIDMGDMGAPSKKLLNKN